MSRATIEAQIKDLGAEHPWFHSIDLGDGLLTRDPVTHLANLRASLDAHLPPDFSGLSVLDIGCNAGYFSTWAKRRNAETVVGVDMGEGYLEQAEFVRKTLSLDIEYRRMSVYDIEELGRPFDIVLCLGVIYHLANPFDAARAIFTVTKDMAVVESAMIPDTSAKPMWEFVFQGYEDDPRRDTTEERHYNWWFPNHAGLRTLLEKAGFLSVEPIYTWEDRTGFLCRR